jgi:histidinol-phosphate aminotransferase
MTSPEKLIRPEILALKAYHVPPSRGMVKLDAMENPYPLPEPMRKELAAALARVDLNRYPEPTPHRLIELLKQKMQVPEGMEVLLGNGSDELIQMITLAVAKPGAVLMYPGPSFVMYAMNATFFGLRPVSTGLREDFTLDREVFLAAMREHRPAVIYLAYPNNPTGVLYGEDDVLAILRAAEGLVVLDEAYHAFAQKTFMSRLTEFPNLLVLRTVSKLGLAGIRLGYLAGAKRWLEQFDKVRSPYNINVLTEATAVFVLERLEVLEKQAAAIRAERATLGKALAALPGVTVFPTEANFFLIRVPDAPRTFEGLRAQGVLVKQLHPGIRNGLRVTVGTPDENRILLSALKEAL